MSRENQNKIKCLLVDSVWPSLAAYMFVQLSVSALLIAWLCMPTYSPSIMSALLPVCLAVYLRYSLSYFYHALNCLLCVCMCVCVYIYYTCRRLRHHAS